MYQRLVRYAYFQRARSIYQHTLATQARVDARIACPVYEIFLSVAQLGYELSTLFQVYMAGAACAHHTAVVVKLYIIIEGYFKYALIGGYVLQYHWFDAFLVKFKFYSIHWSVYVSVFRTAKVWHRGATCASCS